MFSTVKSLSGRGRKRKDWCPPNLPGKSAEWSTTTPRSQPRPLVKRLTRQERKCHGPPSNETCAEEVSMDVCLGRRRMAFARSHLKQDPIFWSTTVWSWWDEVGVIMPHGCWIRLEEERGSIQTEEQCVYRQAWWWNYNALVCFSSNSTGNLVVVQWIVRKEDYIRIFDLKNMKESADKLKLGYNWKYQQDDDPKHTAKVVKKWLKDNDIIVLSVVWWMRTSLLRRYHHR